MAGIDELIANSARTNADFSQIGNISKSYWEGQDQAYKQKMRNVFSDENGGLPRDQDGKVDFQKAYERLVTVGGAPAIDQAGSMATSGLTQDRIRFAPQAASILRGDDQAQRAAAPGGFPAVNITKRVSYRRPSDWYRSRRRLSPASSRRSRSWHATRRQGFFDRLARLAYAGSLN